MIATLLLDPWSAGYEWCVKTHGLVRWCRTHKCCWRAQCCVPHSLSRVRSLCVPPGHTIFPQRYSHCSCKRKHLSAVSSKAKFFGQCCLTNSGISLHTPIKDIFLSINYICLTGCGCIMWYDIYTAKQECKQELKNNSGLFKHPVSSHPANIALWATGDQLSEATKMSTVGENVHSNAPGVALKAVTDMTSTAFCNRSSSADLLAGYLKSPQTRENSCLWRKKLTSFSLLPITHNILVFSSPSA